MGIKDLSKVQQSSHMKFVSKMLLGDSLEAELFHGRYIQNSLPSKVVVKRDDSAFWKVVGSCILKILRASFFVGGGWSLAYVV